MNTPDLTTRTQKSLLLYLECRAVDHSGKLDSRHLNDEDRSLLKEWTDKEFIQSGRIAYKSITDQNCSTWATLSEQEWAEAHRLRRERAAKGWNDRIYQTTAEKNAQP